MKCAAIITLAFCSATIALSQAKTEKQLSGEYSPLELISITQSASFDQAMRMLSAVSELVTGKTIVSAVSDPSPIGVEIKRMYYKDALNLIVNKMNLVYEEKEQSIVVGKKGVTEKEVLNDDTYADLNAREVRISAIFFEADLEKTRKRGIDWSSVLSRKGVSIGAEIRSETVPSAAQALQQAKQPDFTASTTTDYRIGKWTGNSTAMFRFFESENLGEVLASPSIAVRNKQKGRIQIGSDFSIKQRDFSGNIIDRFYSSGSIITVTPYIYSKNKIDYILLKLDVERSTFIPSDLTTEVKKTAATSDVLLLNGEETMIGGLYVNEDVVVRTGIPFLRDLPWWVLGLRYLTGSDETTVRKKEVIILIRAELLPTLSERGEKSILWNPIKEKLEKDDLEIDLYKSRTLKPKE
jgi:general secretion pathway protein D